MDEVHVHRQCLINPILIEMSYRKCIYISVCYTQIKCFMHAYGDWLGQID